MSIFNDNKPLNPKLKAYNGTTIYLKGYDHPLPEGLKKIGGYLSLEGYEHPLPEGLKTINGGYLYLYGYKHPLPDGLKKIGGYLSLYGYDHPLPEGLTVDGDIYVGNYDLTKHKLPGQMAVKVFMKWAEETGTGHSR